MYICIDNQTTLCLLRKWKILKILYRNSSMPLPLSKRKNKIPGINIFLIQTPFSIRLIFLICFHFLFSAISYFVLFLCIKKGYDRILFILYFFLLFYHEQYLLFLPFTLVVIFIVAMLSNLHILFRNIVFHRR